MPGYSKTPLIKKLGIREGTRIFIKNPPGAYTSLVGELPAGTEVKMNISKELDFIHVFCRSSDELRVFMKTARQFMKPDGMIWVSWPKKTSKVQSDLTEDVIRAICLPLDLVDIKVCAVDATWSALKLVIRKEKRKN